MFCEALAELAARAGPGYDCAATPSCVLVLTYTTAGDARSVNQKGRVLCTPFQVFGFSFFVCMCIWGLLVCLSVCMLSLATCRWVVCVYVPAFGCWVFSISVAAQVRAAGWEGMRISVDMYLAVTAHILFELSLCYEMACQ